MEFLLLWIASEGTKFLVSFVSYIMISILLIQYKFMDIWTIYTFMRLFGMWNYLILFEQTSSLDRKTTDIISINFSYDVSLMNDECWVEWWMFFLIASVPLFLLLNYNKKKNKNKIPAHSLWMKISIFFFLIVYFEMMVIFFFSFFLSPPSLLNPLCFNSYSFCLTLLSIDSFAFSFSFSPFPFLFLSLFTSFPCPTVSCKIFDAPFYCFPSFITQHYFFLKIK